MILIWWSSIRLLRDWIRPSNDLDYDSIWINIYEFQNICWDIENMLNNLWFSVKQKKAKEFDSNDIYHCSFDIQSDFKIDEEFISLKTSINLNLKIDLKDSNWNYDTEWIVPFRSQTWINVLTATLWSLLSKKIIWFLSRLHTESVAKDLTDIVFLLQYSEPDYNYLYEYEEIKDSVDLLERIVRKYNRIPNEILEIQTEKLNKNLFDKDFLDIPLIAIETIKDQLSYYNN